MHSRKCLAVAIASLCASAQAAPTVVDTAPISMSAPNGKIAVKISEPVKATEGSLAAIVAPVADRKKRTDITPLVTPDGQTVNLDFANSPMGDGPHRVRMFVVSLDGKWTEIGAVTVIPGEGAAAAVDPNAKPAVALKLDIGTAAQVLERTYGGAQPSARPHYANLTMQGTVETNHLGDDWEVKSQIQLAGSSYRQEVPSFGKLGVNAPKIDIASYLVEAGYKDAKLNIGHISVDTHPLISSGLSNRGVQFQQKLPLNIDMAVAMQNGESVVGYRNLSGLTQRNNQHRSFGVGYDIYQNKPGNFRLDFNSAQSRIFNGNSPTGEHLYDESIGHGGRVIWRNDNGSLRAEGVVAKSEFKPASPAEGAPTKAYGQARTIELGADPIKEHKLTETLPASVTLGFRSEYSSPFYRSLGSGFGSNYRIFIETATVKLGNVQMQWQATQRYDNVGEDRLYMRNRVRANTFSMSFPIAQFFAENLGSKKRIWYSKPTPPPPVPPVPPESPTTTTPAATPAAPADATPPTQGTPAAPATDPTVAPSTPPATAPSPTPTTVPVSDPIAATLAQSQTPPTPNPAPSPEPNPAPTPTPAPSESSTAPAPAAEAAPAAQAPTAPPADPTVAAAPAAAPPASMPEQPLKVSPWWPAITFNQQLNHGFGDPDFVPTGYTVDDLPNVRVITRSWGFAWTFEKIAFGLKSNKTDNQNHQFGKETQSTWDRRYSANADWKITDKLSVGIAYDPSRNYRFESNTNADARQLRGNVTWSINDEWQFTGEINHSSDSESTSTRFNRINASQVQLSRRFQLPFFNWKKLPTQFYLRASESRGFNNTGTGQILEPRTTRVQLGFTITLF